jgi:hypothetical protein
MRKHDSNAWRALDHRPSAHATNTTSVAHFPDFPIATLAMVHRRTATDLQRFPESMISMMERTEGTGKEGVLGDGNSFVHEAGNQ